MLHDVRADFVKNDVQSRRLPVDFGFFNPLVKPCGRLGYAGLRYREPALFARAVVA